jgi:GR25 family glycosyltransferase involved in LPS biosynthesis
LFLSGILFAEDRGLLIPLYSCPSDKKGRIWEKVKKASHKISIVVIWGIICEKDDYVSALKSFGKAGIKRLAYIATGNCKKPLSKIKKRIDFYSKYPVDGFFLDEVVFSQKTKAYINNIIDYAKIKYGITKFFANSPYVNSNYLKETLVDTVVIFENSFKFWKNFEIRKYKDVSRSKVAVLLHHVPLSNLEEAVVNLSKSNVKWIYITDKDWDELPSYLFKEIELINN